MQTTLIDDAEEASFSLNGMLAGFDENTSAYAHMPTKNPYSHFCFALSIEMTAEEDAIVMQLLPMFYGNEDNAKEFIGSIQGMKGKQITDMVNMLITEKKLSELSCHRDLYKVLHNAGIYDKSESNWNMQVK